MLEWQQRGPAVVSPVVLTTGRRATVVIAGGANNPKGAAVVLPGKTKGEVETVLLVDALPHLHPSCVIEICAMQVRMYGDSALPKPSELKRGT